MVLREKERAMPARAKNNSKHSVRAKQNGVVKEQRSNYVSYYLSKPRAVDVTFVRMAASLGINFNEVTCLRTGMSMLHVACLYGHYNISKVLIEECGVDVNLRVSVRFKETSDRMVATPSDAFCSYLQGRWNRASAFHENDIKLIELLRQNAARLACPEIARYLIRTNKFTDQHHPLIRFLLCAGYRISCVSGLPMRSTLCLDSIIRSGVDVRKLSRDQPGFFAKSISHKRVEASVVQLLSFSGVSSNQLISTGLCKSGSIPPLQALCIATVYRNKRGRAFLPDDFFRWPHEDLYQCCDDQYIKIPWYKRQ